MANRVSVCFLALVILASGVATETLASVFPAANAQTTSIDLDDDEKQALLGCGLCAGVALIIPVFFLIISIVLAIWMYKDAQRRGDDQAVLWALVGFFLNLLGLLIYWIAKRNAPPPSPPAP